VLESGAFRRRTRGSGGHGAAAVDLPALLGVLTDVARALQYLHSLRLVHGDVKASGALGVGRGSGQG
jgi:serine/threonine protein kinase